MTLGHGRALLAEVCTDEQVPTLLRAMRRPAQRWVSSWRRS